MKRYVKASHVTSYERDKKIYDALSHDYNALSKCKTAEDVKNGDWWYTRWNKYIDQEVEKSGGDELDAVDTLAYDCLEILVKAKNDLKKAKEKWLAGNRYMAEIATAIEEGGFDIVQADEETIIVVEPEGSTREDLIKFVDSIKDIIGGRYYGTGRGGSWTAWNLMSPDGVEFQAGFNSHARFDKDVPNNTWCVRTV